MRSAQSYAESDRLSAAVRALHHVGGRPLAGRPCRRRGRPRAGAAQVRRAAGRGHRRSRRRRPGPHTAVSRPIRRRQDPSHSRPAHVFAPRRQGLLRLCADDARRRQLCRLLPAPADQFAGKALRSRPGRRKRARPPHQPPGQRPRRARRPTSSRSCARPSSAMPSWPNWCSPLADDIVAAPRLPARTSTSTSCARCSICSAPIRASTSACANTSTAGR